MADDDKKFPRKGGPKPSGPRNRDGGPKKGGKSGFAGKPRFEGGKPFEKREGAAKKPFAKRRDETAGDERPKREFRRDDRPRAERDGRPERSGAPFRKGSRPDAKPSEKRESGTRPGRFERERMERGERTFQPRPEGKAERGDERMRPTSPSREEVGTRSGAGGGDGRTKTPISFRQYRGAREAEMPARPRYGRNDPPHKGEGEDGERIAKRLARVGIASRRDAEELIAAGRVKVNGKVLSSPAFNVMPEDTIELDGTAIPPIERTRLFLFHKPAGVVTTNRDPEGRKTVFDILPEGLPRLMTVGRLDINTEGLLLLTNDGGLSRVLELPATGWLRRYRVRVHGKVDEKQLAELKHGLAVDGVFYGAVEATLDREQGTNAWLTIGLREGKNREVKNILGALGLDVTRLIRISYGPFQLGELPEGHVQEISGRMLRDQLGERLVEESGANFDAEIVKPFSNKPVRRAHAKPAEAAPERRPRAARPLQVGEGGLVKNRKRDNERHREDMLGRLQTKPDRGRFEGKGPKGDRKFGDKKFGEKKPGERVERGFEPPKPRTANVWMAPGARPIGKGRTAAEKAEHEARKASRGKRKGFSPIEGEMSAKRTEGVSKGSAGRKKTLSTSPATPSGRTLPSGGRNGRKPPKGR
jgi:23S rRNA pseudouridine2605 synthase